jgi:glycosyltransferase involved in cell wall biosynthesis
MKLTIYVPTARPSELSKFLSSLAGQLTSEVELVISDNNNSQQIVEQMKTEGKIEYIKNQTDIGGDLNILRGFTAGTGDWIWLIGDDDEILPNGINQVLKAIKQDDADRIILLSQNSPREAAGASGSISEIAKLDPGLPVAATLITANVLRRSSLNLTEANNHLETRFGHAWANTSCKRIKVLDTPIIKVGAEHIGEGIPKDFNFIGIMKDLLTNGYHLEIGPKTFSWNFVSLKRMKILWYGPVMNPTGISTAGREMVKALSKKCQVQVMDPYQSIFEFNKDLKELNNQIDVKDCDATIVFDYPQFMPNKIYGRYIGHFIHEGTKLFDGWAHLMNRVEKMFVASEANRKMFNWNGINKPIKTISYGYNPEMYKPNFNEKTGTFIFLSVNSWTGEAGDRKGTDLLIKAFDEEFKNEDVRLLLKISTFWQRIEDPLFYQKKVIQLIGHTNPNILINDKYIKEEELAGYYQKSDCFVSPTRGEGFGLTILNSLASGCPVIVPKDINAGYYDFCKGNKGVLWIDVPSVKQGDLRFYAQGNMLAEPDINSLKKQMRWAFEHRKELTEMGKEGYEFIKDLTWDKCADEIIKYVKG